MDIAYTYGKARIQYINPPKVDSLTRNRIPQEMVVNIHKLKFQQYLPIIKKNPYARRQIDIVQTFCCKTKIAS